MKFWVDETGVCATISEIVPWSEDDDPVVLAAPDDTPIPEDRLQHLLEVAGEGSADDPIAALHKRHRRGSKYIPLKRIIGVHGKALAALRRQAAKELAA